MYQDVGEWTLLLTEYGRFWYAPPFVWGVGPLSVGSTLYCASRLQPRQPILALWSIIARLGFQRSGTCLDITTT